MSGAGVAKAFVQARLGLAERGGLIDRRGDGAGRGVVGLPGVDCPCVKAIAIETIHYFPPQKFGALRVRGNARKEPGSADRRKATPSRPGDASSFGPRGLWWMAPLARETTRRPASCQARSGRPAG